MTRGLAIGLVIALMGIIGGMAIVHHHEDQDREREIFRYQQGPNGVRVEVNPPYINREPYRDQQCRPRNCDGNVLIRLHNDIRCSGLYRMPRYSMCPNLCQEAQRHAMAMARSGRIIGHYGYNVACGPVNEYDVFGHWMGNSSSRRNITSNHNMAGFGSAIGRDGRIYWCAIYR